MAQMQVALRAARRRGKGVVAIKVLGCGAPSFVGDAAASLRKVARMGWVDVLCLGMRSLGELRRNATLLAGAGGRLPRCYAAEILGAP